MATKTFKLNAEIAAESSAAWWGKTVGPAAMDEFIAGLDAADEAVIEINSPGGDVVSGLAMANAIKNCKAKTRAHIVGLAASMASVVACACDSIDMEEASFMMVHNPWAYAEGDAEQMRKTAMTLDAMREAIMCFYRGKFAALDDDGIRGMMDAETWISGAEAAKRGLAANVISSGAAFAACVMRPAKFRIPECAARLVDVRADVAAPAISLDEAIRRAAEWEARYKGSSRALNAKDAEMNALKTALEVGKAEAAESAAKIERLESELGAAKSALESANADLGGATARAETAEKALAELGERLYRLEETRRKTAAGALAQPVDNAALKRDALASARTPEEREAVRAKFRGMN